MAGNQGSPSLGGLSSLEDVISTAIEDHGRALAALSGKLGQGQALNLVDETKDCLARLVKTTAQFIVFWDNIATLLAANRDAPRYYPPPPVGAPGTTATAKVDVGQAVSASVGSGLRRRGDDKETVPPSRVVATLSQTTCVVTVNCDGVARGLYEGTLDVVDQAGAADQIVFNVYVDPV